MIYLDAGATTLQKPPAVALAVQSAVRRMAVRKLCESRRVPALAKAQAKQIVKERKGT